MARYRCCKWFCCYDGLKFNETRNFRWRCCRCCCERKRFCSTLVSCLVANYFHCQSFRALSDRFCCWRLWFCWVNVPSLSSSQWVQTHPATITTSFLFYLQFRSSYMRQLTDTPDIWCVRNMKSASISSIVPYWIIVIIVTDIIILFIMLLMLWHYGRWQDNRYWPSMVI